MTGPPAGFDEGRPGGAPGGPEGGMPSPSTNIFSLYLDFISRDFDLDSSLHFDKQPFFSTFYTVENSYSGAKFKNFIAFCTIFHVKCHFSSLIGLHENLVTFETMDVKRYGTGHYPQIISDEGLFSELSNADCEKRSRLLPQSGENYFSDSQPQIQFFDSPTLRYSEYLRL